MIPCYVCGKNASTGWIQGFVPAPDSQKLALCAEHNTPDNRLLVGKAWRELNERDISAMASVAKHKAAPTLQVASVHFTGGGLLSFTCTACTPTNQGTLRIEQADGTHTFIPMQHIREYAIRPYAPTSPAGGAHTSGPASVAAPDRPNQPDSLAELLPPEDGDAPAAVDASPSEQAEEEEALPVPVSQ